MKATPRVLCLVTDGFDELKLIAPVDLLRRAKVEVVIASLAERDVVARLCGRGKAREIAAEIAS